MHQVASCPDSEQNVTQASKNLGCAEDRYGNNQYICVPNVKKTALVEFCYNNTMGIEEKGHCLVASGKDLISQSCEAFLTGCPQDHFLKTDFYKYPACQQINRDKQCYTSDPSCSMISNETIAGPDIIWVILLSVFSIIIFLLVVMFWGKQRKVARRKKGSSFDTNVRYRRSESMPNSLLRDEAENVRIQIEALENEEEIEEVARTIKFLRLKLVDIEIKSKIKLKEPNPDIPIYRY
nr:uncharacterized protein LOC111101206 isoform X3 [Crassostrea virginica]XP_022289297.1 uncharacterized protein LOC111101206 isoform X3 [Crassostrea virginica]